MFNTTETNQIKQTIEQAYKLDSDVISKWLNVAGSGFDSCVADQVNALSSQPTFKMFKVEEDSNFVGYFGIEEDGRFMATIFITPEYRPRKKEFWKEVESKMTPTFFCAGYHKNKPACNYYAKFGKAIGSLETKDGPVTMFEFKRSQRWQ